MRSKVPLLVLAALASTTAVVGTVVARRWAAVDRPVPGTAASLDDFVRRLAPRAAKARGAATGVADGTAVVRQGVRYATRWGAEVRCTQLLQTDSLDYPVMGKAEVDLIRLDTREFERADSNPRYALETPERLTLWLRPDDNGGHGQWTLFRAKLGGSAAYIHAGGRTTDVSTTRPTADVVGEQWLRDAVAGTTHREYRA